MARNRLKVRRCARARRGRRGIAGHRRRGAVDMVGQQDATLLEGLARGGADEAAGRDSHRDARPPARRGTGPGEVRSSSAESTAPGGTAIPPANAMPLTRRATNTSRPASESRITMTVEASLTGRPVLTCASLMNPVSPVPVCRITPGWIPWSRWQSRDGCQSLSAPTVAAAGGRRGDALHVLAEFPAVVETG